MGIRKEEGASRKSVKCITFGSSGKIKSFHPLAVVTADWIEWFINSYNVDICKIYYAPYKFQRTGCKGCPYNVYLQEELNVIRQFFPNEYNQCEIIWKPVYDEYRRIKYRLSRKVGDDSADK